MDKNYYTVTVKGSDDKERIKHDLTCCTEGLANIPDRECPCVDLKKYSSKRATYLLTDEEAEELKKDSRVKSINLDIRYYDDIHDEIIHFADPPPFNDLKRSKNNIVLFKDIKKSPFYEYKCLGRLGDGNIVYEETFLEEKYQQDLEYRKRRQEIIDNKKPDIIQKINLNETFNLQHEYKKQESYKITIDNNNKKVLVEGDCGYKKYFEFEHYLNRARIEVDNLILSETDVEGNVHERWYSITGDILMIKSYPIT